MHASSCARRSRTRSSRGSPGLQAGTAILLFALQAVPAAAQVQTLGTPPPPSGTLSTPSGPRTVSSKPVNSAPVTSRSLGSTQALPSSAAGLPSIASGGSAPSTSWPGTSGTQGARLSTFASPRPAPRPEPSTGIGTAALPFPEPVIDARRLRLPIAPDRPQD